MASNESNFSAKMWREKYVQAVAGSKHILLHGYVSILYNIRARSSFGFRFFESQTVTSKSCCHDKVSLFTNDPLYLRGGKGGGAVSCFG